MQKRRKVARLSSKEMAANNSSYSTSSSSTEIIDQSSLVADIRRQIAKWQRSQQDAKLRELKEHEKYEARVILDGGKLTPSIQCKVCTKSYSLGLKDGKPMISNWTKHVSKCENELLQQHFQPTIPLPSTSGDALPFTDQQPVYTRKQITIFGFPLPHKGRGIYQFKHIHFVFIISSSSSPVYIVF